jgi:hypothetical protein
MPRVGQRIAHPTLTLVVLALLAVPGLPPLTRAQAGVAATITAVEGQAEVIAPGGASVPAKVGLRVLPGSTVRTKANGRVELQFDDRSLLRLDKNTEVRLLSGAQERGVMVTLGNIWAKVQSVFGASKFQVKTPTVVAGVRGTVLRAEVTEDEAEIAVDEGEVEVTPIEGEGPVIVGANERVRASRGARNLRPDRFDPQARTSWEYWTDPLAQEEAERLRAAAEAAHQACEEVHRRTTEVRQALLIDNQAAARLQMRVSAAHQLVAGVKIALGEMPPPPDGPGRRSGPPPTKGQLGAWLNTADGVYVESAPLLDKGREAMQRHTADLQALRDALAAQQAAEQTLAAGLQAFRHCREVDPHWPAFRAPWEHSEALRGRIGRNLADCGPLLAPGSPEQLGPDHMALKTVEHQYAWGAKTLEALARQIGGGRDEVRRLRARVGALPDGPVRPPAPRRAP